MQHVTETVILFLLLLQMGHFIAAFSSLSKKYPSPFTACCVVHSLKYTVMAEGKVCPCFVFFCFFLVHRAIFSKRFNEEELPYNTQAANIHNAIQLCNKSNPRPSSCKAALDILRVHSHIWAVLELYRGGWGV